MNYPGLIAALPAETVTAVSGTPQGLTTNGEVYVSDRRRAATSTTEAWWRLVEVRTIANLLGGSLVAYDFELRMSKAGGTRAELEVWANQVRAHFHGEAVPASISGLKAVSIQSIDLDDLESEGEDVELVIGVTFTGLETP